MDERFIKSLRDMAEEAARQKAAEAEREAYRHLSPFQRMQVGTRKTVQAFSGLVVDFTLVPLTLYSLYILLWMTGTYAIPRPPSFWAILIPYLMFRMVAFEFVMQARKVNKR